MIFSDYAKYYDLFNNKKPYRKEAQFVYKWAGKPKSIFDIGPGTARHWNYYPKGTILTGVEKSRKMIEASKHKTAIFEDDIQTYQHYEALYGIFDCATALFQVINYIPTHDWWDKLPILKGSAFIIDIWSAKKAIKDGFDRTLKQKNGVSRMIVPVKQSRNAIDLEVIITKGEQEFKECHTMYLYTLNDISKFCRDDYEIAEVKETESWQTWIKLIRK